jgi:DNA-binding NarL/FixJ family response regulator
MAEMTDPKASAASDPVGVHRAEAITGQDPEAATGPGLPIRVAAIDDYEVIVAGLAAMLGQFPDRLHVCEAVLQGEPVEGDAIDVALYDTYGRIGISVPTIEFLSAMDGINAIAVYTMDVTQEVVDEALAAGARAVITKKLPGGELADTLIRVACGEQMIVGLDETDHEHPGDPTVDWPGRAAGLSLRESEVLALVANGMTNREIARSLFIGEQTVKSHVRQILAKLDVTNRTQAARFAADHRSFRQGPSSRNDVR